jgi:hypothetical protein
VTFIFIKDVVRVAIVTASLTVPEGWRNVSYTRPKDVYLFVLYLTTLSVPQLVLRRMTGC